MVLAEQAAGRLRLGAFGRVYAACIFLLGLAMLYLFIAGHAAGSSYGLERLRAQQEQLKVERDQLRYDEDTRHAPANVEKAAAAAGLQRTAAQRYLDYHPVRIELSAPIGPGLPDTSPPWQQWLSALGRLAGGAS